VKDDGAELDRLWPRAEDEKRLNHGGSKTLAVAECDPALRQVIGRQFHRHPVARQHANAVSAKPPRQMGQNYSFVFQLNAE
jgi:hypothetical protein